MDKSTTPFGESVKWQSVTKKIFELAKASPADFFINISPLFTLSKIQIIHWGSNKSSVNTEDRILEYLQQNPKTTIKELSLVREDRDERTTGAPVVLPRAPLGS